MLITAAVSLYLVLWLILRAVALRLSKPAAANNRSPWFTRIALAYCFLCALGFAFARVWWGWGDHEGESVMLLFGVALAACALVAETMCLLSLGPHYSLEMQIKVDHSIVASGPYRFVRHPMYLSNIIGFLGLCVLIRHWAMWAGFVGQVFGFILMARQEEAFLLSHLGEKYQTYRQKVRWMLIPGLL